MTGDHGQQDAPCPASPARSDRMGGRATPTIRPTVWKMFILAATSVRS